MSISGNSTPNYPFTPNAPYSGNSTPTRLTKRPYADLLESDDSEDEYPHLNKRGIGGTMGGTISTPQREIVNADSVTTAVVAPTDNSDIDSDVNSGIVVDVAVDNFVALFGDKLDPAGSDELNTILDRLLDFMKSRKTIEPCKIISACNLAVVNRFAFARFRSILKDSVDANNTSATAKLRALYNIATSAANVYYDIVPKNTFTKKCETMTTDSDPRKVSSFFSVLRGKVAIDSSWASTHATFVGVFGSLFTFLLNCSTLSDLESVANEVSPHFKVAKKIKKAVNPLFVPSLSNIKTAYGKLVIPTDVPVHTEYFLNASGVLCRAAPTSRTTLDRVATNVMNSCDEDTLVFSHEFMSGKVTLRIYLVNGGFHFMVKRSASAMVVAENADAEDGDDGGRDDRRARTYFMAHLYFSSEDTVAPCIIHAITHCILLNISIALYYQLPELGAYPDIDTTLEDLPRKMYKLLDFTNGVKIVNNRKTYFF